MNTPLTRTQVKDLPIGFTATTSGENRRERRLNKQPTNKNNRSMTKGRRWFREEYMPKEAKRRLKIAEEVRQAQEDQSFLEKIMARVRSFFKRL